MGNKTRKQVLTQAYVNRHDLEILLQLPRCRVKTLYEEVDKQESQMPFRPHENKVLLQNVLKVLGINYGFLERQIKEEI